MSTLTDHATLFGYNKEVKTLLSRFDNLRPVITPVAK